MDKKTKSEVFSVVELAIEKSMQNIMEQYDEQYVTAQELSSQYQMFTPDWLKKYGKLLPQAQAVVTDADGVERRTRVAYAKHKIARMIADGSIERLTAMAK